MKILEWLKPWGMATLLALLLLWGTTLHAAVPPAWKDTGFSINATSMTLRGVMDEFSRTYGVRLEMGPEGERLVHNRLKADNGVDFLNRLAATFKFRWFVYNNTLYVVPSSDNTSMRLEVGEDAVQDAKAALVGLGLFDDRYGWGELPDEGVVIISGPRKYVELARNILLPEEKKEMRKGKQIMLFRLKYASAMDRVINSRGKSETIPGIKTILSNLLFGARGSGEKVSGDSSSEQFDADSRKRSRTSRVASGGAREVTSDRFSPLFSAPSSTASNALQSDGATSNSGRTSSSSGEDDVRPRIEADPTLNAIMIYDDIKKKDIYASLIAQLDIQPQQVEIEALIVDIDRSKLSEMGVEWGVRAGAVNSTINSTMTDSAGLTTPLPGATLLISNVARFYARLKAMESTGDAHVVATPTVLTLDNVAAVLDLSQSAYVSLIGERVADMSDITAGTKLRVIPRIIHEGNQTRVRLEVDIEDGSLDSSNSGSSSSSSSSSSSTGTSSSIAASVTRSTISTQAIIDMQQTLMIGGYRAESLTKNKQKVPLLGDIPFLGGLFRSESQSTSTRERLFLITPRITGTDGVAASTTSQTTESARQNARAQRAAAKAASEQAGAATPVASNAAPALSDALPAAANGSSPAPSNGPLVATVAEAPAMAMGSGVHVPLRSKAPTCAKPKTVGVL